MLLSSLPPLWIIILILSIGCSSIGQGQTEVSKDFSSTDAAIKEIIQNKVVPGISLAIFNDEGLLFHRSGGVKNIRTGEPIDSLTAFEAASLSKTLFAYMALEFMEEGTLSLSTPLYSEWVAKSLKNDPGHKKLTPLNLLTHTAGLPNWRGVPNLEAKSKSELFNIEDSLKIMFEPNSKFSYSGEGYIYLQNVLEKMTDKSLNTLADKYVFFPLDMDHSSFVFDSVISGNFAFGHDENNDIILKYKPKVPLAAASLHTNSIDYAKFFIELVRKVKTNEAFKYMIEGAIKVEENKTYQIFWGLGVGIMRFNNKPYLFHWGDNGVFKSYYMYSIEDKLGFVYFANGVKGLSIRNELSKSIFGDYVPMWPEDYEQVINVK